MKVAGKYSHLNGEEYLIVHHKAIYEEIRDVINIVDASKFKTKASKEKNRQGKLLYNPVKLNSEFKRLFEQRNWEDKRYYYYVTTDHSTTRKLALLSLDDQKKSLIESGVENPIRSHKQIDFFKEGIAVEVQFGMYLSAAYDLFIRHPFLYSGGVINVGIEVLPMKSMQSEMSPGIAYYEEEVHNVLRHGRNSLAVPLLIMGVAPERGEESDGGK